MHTAQPSSSPRARRLLVWLLLCLLPLQGLATVLVQGFGALHFHAPAAAVAGAVGDPMQGWQDFRRMIHGEAPEASHYAHDGLQRHHHAAADEHSAVVVDFGGGDAAQSDEAPATSAGALAQAMGPLGDDAVALPSAAHDSWTAVPSAPMATRQPAPLERPPRAA